MRPELKVKPIPEIDGALCIESPYFSDHRGAFYKIYEDFFGFNETFESFRQVNISDNSKVGTLRGMHFQIPPFDEYKLVTCIRGAVFDVMVDLRPNSKTFKSWFSTTLTAFQKSVLIPPLVAHGFQTLDDDTSLLYLHSAAYSSSHSRGLSPFDSTLGIPWPKTITRISSSDKSLPSMLELLES